MPERLAPFTLENKMARVPHELLWADADFCRWAGETYGHQNRLTDLLASVVTLGPEDHLAPSFRTGGRVVYYPLKKPFFHRQTGRAITHVDVKGVGLTRSGFLREKDMLSHFDYAEILRHTIHDEPRGPLIAQGLADAMSLVEEAQFALRQGFSPPPPLALIKPKHLFLNGQPTPPREILTAYGYRPRADFPALFVRGYPTLPARISDYLTWKNDPTCLPIFEIDHQTFALGRKLWLEHYHQIPKACRPEPTRLFRAIQAQLIRQARQMISHGISPLSGAETNRSPTPNHLHLQNYLVPRGELVEWSPLTHAAKLRPYWKALHFKNIIQSSYEAYLSLGALILNQRQRHQLLLSPDEFVSKAARDLCAGGQLIDLAYSPAGDFFHFLVGLEPW